MFTQHAGANALEAAYRELDERCAAAGIVRTAPLTALAIERTLSTPGKLVNSREIDAFKRAGLIE